MHTIPFESDHKAVLFQIELEDQEILLKENETDIRLNYNKADWKIFQSELTECWLLDIPADRNLIINEIDRR